MTSSLRWKHAGWDGHVRGKYAVVKGVHAGEHIPDRWCSAHGVRGEEVMVVVERVNWVRWRG